MEQGRPNRRFFAMLAQDQQAKRAATEVRLSKEIVPTNELEWIASTQA